MSTNVFKPAHHIPYGQGVLPYHKKVAMIIGGLVDGAATVLDVGCGNGAGTELICRENGLQVTALDGDPECVKIVQKRLGDMVEVEHGDASRLPGRKFDIVTSSHVAEHLEDPSGFVLDLWDLVEKEGYMVLCVPNILTPIRIVNALFGRDRTNDGHMYGWDYGHFELFLKRCGLPRAEIYTDAVPLLPGRYRGKYGWIEAPGVLVSRVAPRLSESLIAVIAK